MQGLIAVTVFAIAGMTAFGLLWFRALNQLRKTEAERDELWDQVHGVSDRALTPLSTSEQT